jgi:hypothetical protein
LRVLLEGFPAEFFHGALGPGEVRRPARREVGLLCRADGAQEFPVAASENDVRPVVLLGQFLVSPPVARGDESSFDG